MITLSDADKRGVLRRAMERALSRRKAGTLTDADLEAITIGTARVIDAHALPPVVQIPQQTEKPQ